MYNILIFSQKGVISMNISKTIKLIKRRILKEDLNVRLRSYFNKYDNNSYIIVKIIYWLFLRLFFEIFNFAKNKKSSDKLSIAFGLGGGIGDVLVHSVYVKEFVKMLDVDADIYLYVHRDPKISKQLFEEWSFVKGFFDTNRYDKEAQNYDLAIGLGIIPRITYFNKEVLEKSPFLSKIVQTYILYEEQNSTMLEYGSIAKVILRDEILNKKSIQQIDVERLLDIKADTKSYMSYNPNQRQELKDIVENEIYITISRNVDSVMSNKNNTRLWFMEYYCELINKIKEKYPYIKTVQIGTQRSERINGIDIDLCGKTDISEVKYILKHALLHIDGECGMVHLRHALNEISCVFFAQTSMKLKGYDENINLKSNACPHWCEWISSEWQTKCIAGYDKPVCMAELKPDFVFEKITPFIDKALLNFKKQVRVISIDEFKKLPEVKNKKIVFLDKEFKYFAQTLDKSNKITIFDEYLNYGSLADVKKSGFEAEFSNIYNIALDCSSADIVFYNKKNVEFEKYAFKEMKRVLKNDGVIVETILNSKISEGQKDEVSVG